MQEWQASLPPEFYLIVINSRWQIQFYALVEGVLFKRSSLTHAMGLRFLKISIYLFISEAPVIGVARMETLTDEAHNEEGLMQCMLQIL